MDFIVFSGVSANSKCPGPNNKLPSLLLQETRWVKFREYTHRTWSGEGRTPVGRKQSFSRQEKPMGGDRVMEIKRGVVCACVRERQEKLRRIIVHTQ